SATANYPSGFAGDVGGTFPRNIWYYTPDALKNAIINNSTWLAGNDGPTGRHNYGAEWKVKEKNFAGYVQANFSGDWWSGNVGLRYVNIKQDIDTYNAVSNAADADVSSLFGMWERTAFQNKRNRVLPSANIKFDLDDRLVLRVA
ncbi:TPA: outer membrane beta-barrel protein, partial [Escherichia coli]|nr:outer membrane beta-barrel protein [Escherichia coli]